MTNGIISWDDGTTIADVPTDVWKVNEPNGDAGGCVEVVSIISGMQNYKQVNSQDPLLNGQWIDYPCTLHNDWGGRSIGGVCKKSANPCGAGWSYVNGSCYTVGEKM